MQVPRRYWQRDNLSKCWVKQLETSGSVEYKANITIDILFLPSVWYASAFLVEIFTNYDLFVTFAIYILLVEKSYICVIIPIERSSFMKLLVMTVCTAKSLQNIMILSVPSHISKIIRIKQRLLSTKTLSQTFEESRFLLPNTLAPLKEATSHNLACKLASSANDRSVKSQYPRHCG